ncbi:type II toxin-antitoxin system VapC family toxin [Fulvimarina sp. MAC8]|uniref:PIN domain-containing protein n=1 Tax=Fulvimarina sp. MAC8 TaxID=3162874 RepID=UPI0032EFCBEC
MTGMVLDTSAIMAFLRDEVGADKVASMLEDRAIISTVNVQELLASLASKGMAPEDARLAVRSLNLEGRDLTWELAERAAELVEWTKAFGLSLGDRSCLALARMLDMPAVTADRVWSNVAETIGVEVIVIR